MVSVTRTQTATANIAVEKSGTSDFITSNGVRILEFNKDGHLRRLKTKPTDNVVLRRLDDGRVAIKPRVS